MAAGWRRRRSVRTGAGCSCCAARGRWGGGGCAAPEVVCGAARPAATSSSGGAAAGGGCSAAPEPPAAWRLAGGSRDGWRAPAGRLPAAGRGGLAAAAAGAAAAAPTAAVLAVEGTAGRQAGPAGGGPGDAPCLCRRDEVGGAEAGAAAAAGAGCAGGMCWCWCCGGSAARGGGQLYSSCSTVDCCAGGHSWPTWAASTRHQKVRSEQLYLLLPHGSASARGGAPHASPRLWTSTSEVCLENHRHSRARVIPTLKGEVSGWSRRAWARVNACVRACVHVACV